MLEYLLCFWHNTAPGTLVWPRVLDCDGKNLEIAVYGSTLVTQKPVPRPTLCTQHQFEVQDHLNYSIKVVFCIHPWPLNSTHTTGWVSQAYQHNRCVWRKTHYTLKRNDWSSISQTWIPPVSYYFDEDRKVPHMGKTVIYYSQNCKSTCITDIGLWLWLETLGTFRSHANASDGIFPNRGHYWNGVRDFSLGWTARALIFLHPSAHCLHCNTEVTWVSTVRQFKLAPALHILSCTKCVIVTQNYAIFGWRWFEFQTLNKSTNGCSVPELKVSWLF